jgi:hypothetical protein
MVGVFARLPARSTTRPVPDSTARSPSEEYPYLSFSSSGSIFAFLKYRAVFQVRFPPVDAPKPEVPLMAAPDGEHAEFDVDGGRQPNRSGNAPPLMLAQKLFEAAFMARLTAL